MNAKTILDSIQEAIAVHKLPTVQKGDLTTLLTNYSELLTEYSALSVEDRATLFDNVKKQRPLIGKNLQERFEKDLSV